MSGDEAFWNAIRTNLTPVADTVEWWKVVTGPMNPVIEDPALLEAAAEALPPEPWDGSTWKAWTDAVKAATGRKGRELFMPLRLALTGRSDGPELARLLPLIGPDRVSRRLRGAVA